MPSASDGQRLVAPAEQPPPDKHLRHGGAARRGLDRGQGVRARGEVDLVEGDAGEVEGALDPRAEGAARRGDDGDGRARPLEFVSPLLLLLRLLKLLISFVDVCCFRHSEGAVAASAACSPWFDVAIVVIVNARELSGRKCDRQGCGGDPKGSELTPRGFRDARAAWIATPVLVFDFGFDDAKRRAARIGGAASAEVEQPAEAVTLPRGRIQRSRRERGRESTRRRSREREVLKLFFFFFFFVEFDKIQKK